MARSVIICADDYALSPGISRAIIELASIGRISAISCLTNTPYWPEHAAMLSTVGANIDIGLHLNLVEGKPLTSMPRTAPDGILPSLTATIVKSHGHCIDLAEIKREILAQLKSFKNALGHAPHFLDGHRHAHLLPGIRDTVLDVIQDVCPNSWVRNTWDRPGRILKRGISIPKALFLAALAKPLLSAAERRRVRTNKSFSGVYSVAGKQNYAELFPKFLDGNDGSHLVMCHPGHRSDMGMEWAETRWNEYRFLKSEDFANLMDSQSFRIARFDDAS